MAKFRTIAKPSEGFFKDRNSKFYAFAFPVENEEDIAKYRNDLRKKYHDARHHVYAFVLGEDKNIYRSSDDGEPHNSSGPPVLNAIKSFDLTNVLVVVVRYFGGKKLGIPGLINAYRTAAEDALNNAEIIEKIPVISLKLSFGFDKMNDVMKFIKQNSLKILKQDYSDTCSISIEADKENVAKYLSDFEKMKVKVDF